MGSCSQDRCSSSGGRAEEEARNGRSCSLPRMLSDVADEVVVVVDEVDDAELPM